MSIQINIAPEVQLALAKGQAVVALESTIIAHGMPYPRNVETAKEVEEIIREQGAVPATIAVIGGQVRVGLSASELESLGSDGSKVLKLSTRDLPYAVATKACGATTVAATMAIAEKAGIEVFVTGGIGGVHRGAGESFDVSADLLELSRTPVAVVCAGAKSILDLRATLEVLETNGVPILGYQTDKFPAFYCGKSALDVDWRLDSAAEIGGFLKAKRALELPGGVLITNPIPGEYAVAPSVIEEALAKAELQGVRGKKVTPFLLKEIVERTAGQSLDANIALVKNNARLGAQVAVSLCE